MTFSFSRPFLALAMAAPLALGACGDNATTGESSRAEAVAAVSAPQGTSWRDTATTTPENGVLVGNPDAPIKLVEYGSLTCPTCARFAEEGMEPLLAKYIDSGRVSYELRNFAVHGPVDLVLARMARCGTTEAVVPLSDQVWKNLGTLMAPIYDNPASLDGAMNQPMEQRFAALAQAGGFYDFFAQRGISADQARACLSDVPAMEKLADDTQRYATSDGINGTPTFMLNGRVLDGINSWAALEPELQRAGAR
ncbi:DsbA family protein [Qipengyuania sp.]|uniref:DsbA family protein n=1 Tax=Qipengyuania sp. TaxID=2004515 RepID=UPI0035C79CDE